MPHRNEVRVELDLDINLLARLAHCARARGVSPQTLLVESVETFLDGLPNSELQAFDSVRAHAICDANGYTDYRSFIGGRDACIARIGFNYAILADITDCGYGDRWCFATYALARAALDAWDGLDETEPQGWHRHPDTGRRRPDGDASREYVCF